MKAWSRMTQSERISKTFLMAAFACFLIGVFGIDAWGWMGAAFFAASGMFE